VLKVMAVNPSKEQAQKVSLKVPLPKEIQPGDVIDKEDMEIVYDTQEGAYCAIGDYELEPGESIERAVEIRNIWLIPDKELETMRLDLDKLSGLLKNTEFFEKFNFLKSSIEMKLNQITETQKDQPANPEQLISVYRENLKILEFARADLTFARSLLAQVRPFPTAVVWRIIIAVIIFLGLLGGTFYFVWQKQVKPVTQDTFYTPKQDEFNIKPQASRDEEEQQLKPKDVDDVLGKTDEES
ncbi:MAG: hypothetical protein V1662_06050, partial [Candidatus Omnitrophota bacterium]